MSCEFHIVDLSHPLSEATTPFPGDPPISIEELDSIAGSPEDGQKHLNCSKLTTSVHCGTHMDAPFHFFSDGKTIDSLPLDVGVGPAVIVSHPAWQANATIEIEQLAPKTDLIESTRRIILSSTWYRHWGRKEYFRDHPVISGEAARWLVELGVVLVGVDFPSVDHAPYPAHHELLGHGVAILENLTNLEAVEVEQIELFAIPLAITGRDGSPVRAMARYARAR